MCIHTTILTIFMSAKIKKKLSKMDRVPKFPLKTPKVHHYIFQATITFSERKSQPAPAWVDDKKNHFITLIMSSCERKNGKKKKKKKIESPKYRLNCDRMS